MALDVLLAGGGTAGHVNPLLATAHSLRERGHRVTVLGTAEGLESTLVPAAGFELVTIPRVPIPRRPSPKLLTLPKRLHEAISAATSAMSGADVVAGYGGYVAGPAYIAAKRSGLPFVVHEQNVRAGWANKLGARNASGVALTFPDTNLKAKRGVTELTGMPLRSEIMGLAKAREQHASALAIRESAAKHFGMDPSLPTVLVTGGSLGAQKLNDTIAAAVQGLNSDIQILHVTGKGKVESALSARSDKSVSVPWFIHEYMNEMDLALATADLVICRAGAGTVAELTAIGMPACYVPLPFGNGEQALNARAQISAGGAFLVKDQDFSVETFLNRVLPLVHDSVKLKEMGRASRAVSPGNGAENLANMIEKAV